MIALATIRDVAARAKTSAATVSRVINNDLSFSVSDATKERIFRAAKELKYKPKRIARSDIEHQMSTKKVSILTVVQAEEEKVDVTWGTIRNNVEQQCASFGIQIQKTLYRTAIDPVDLKDLDGLFVLGTFDVEQIQSLSQNKANLVFVDNTVDVPDYDMVSIDFQNTITKALHHLTTLGHRKIGMIGGIHFLNKINSDDSSDVLDDPLTTHFIVQMKHLGLYDSTIVKQAPWNAQAGYEKMMELIDSPNRPTACFIASDPMAMGALRALQERQIAVPEQMAIIGFDDMEVTAFLNPPLSTFNIFPEQIGKTAAQLMFERLVGRQARIHSTIGTKLIIRSSCGGKVE